MAKRRGVRSKAKPSKKMASPAKKSRRRKKSNLVD